MNENDLATRIADTEIQEAFNADILADNQVIIEINPSNSSPRSIKNNS